MAFGMEARYPFLDEQVVETALPLCDLKSVENHERKTSATLPNVIYPTGCPTTERTGSSTLALIFKNSMP